MANALQILLIEDNPAHQELFTELLAMTEFADAVISVASRLQQGQTLLAEQHCDILFLDLSLPDSEIRQTQQQIPALSEHCPVIVLTSLDDQQTLMQIIQQGADDCLPKIELNEQLLSRSIQYSIDRWALKRRLLTQEYIQRDILNNMTDAVLYLNAQGKISNNNPAAEHIFGYSSAQLQQQDLRSLLPELSLQQLSQLHQQRQIIDSVGRSHDQALLPVEISCSIARFDRNPTYTVFVRDITERKRVEQLKNDFVSTVSHELRTPLTSIKGSLGLVLGGMTGTLPPETHAMLEIASHNCERLLHIINDILDVQKMETGKLTCDLKPLAVKPFIEQAVADNMAYGRQHQVEFQIQEAVNDTILINADEKRLMQAVSNLLSNAAKFSSIQSQVDIRTQVHHNRVRISVQDYGCGIPESFRPKLFQKFSQANSASDRQFGGSGLGLVITRNIIQQHLGQLDYQTRTGQGTLFYIDLPLLDHHDEEPVPTPVP